jgi:hypothetical protein
MQKLQPDRCLALRGFAGFGAGAAITSASSTGFTVSGVWRAADDFAVAVIYDTDDVFDHRMSAYLPDPDLSNLVLQFDATYDDGLMPLDSALFPTIDWPYLDVARWDGSTAQIPLFSHATQVSGTYTAASGVITVSASPAVAFDRVTIWYQNNAADFIASGGEDATTVATSLAAAIAASWPDVNAVASGPNITITARKAGRDGNVIRIYTQSKTLTLTLSTPLLQLAGGSSAATWRVSLDFTALGIDQVRQLWLTFAPPLSDGQAFQSLEWQAVFSNWSIDGSGNAALQVAGLDSVRVEETSSWCTYAGTSWTPTNGGGFYSKGYARVASAIGDSVTINYWCQQTHDLWIGTALYVDRGTAKVLIDGVPAPDLDTRLEADEPLVTRRKIGYTISPGQHTVTLTLESGLFYFDFLEAVVSSDPPAALEPLTNRSAALDYDTDATYKVSPQRLLWNFDQLGLAGPMNLYGGVFWAWQRNAVGAVLPSVTIDFSQRAWSGGTGLGDGDQIFLAIATELLSKTVFPADDAESIAAHFAYFINESSVGTWASVSGPVLTITLRAAGTAYSFGFTATVFPYGGGELSLAFSGGLTGAVQTDWYVDPTQTPVLARHFRDWLADLCAEVAARENQLVVSFSMEFVFPPDDPSTGQVWAARFPDGTKVETDTGFATLVSTQCVFNTNVLEMHKAGYSAVAGIQQAAGLTPEVQGGELSWWYFPNAAGMAFYDAETAAAALAALNRPLHVFSSPSDDPSLWPEDSSFLSMRLASYVQQLSSYLRSLYPSILLEWLLPLDVNFPQVYGADNLGGELLFAINVPTALFDPTISPFDILKVEGLDFGSGSRDMKNAKVAMALPIGQGWPAARLRYLVAAMNGGCPFLREQQYAEAAGYPVILFWAWDHVSSFGWDIRRRLLPTAKIV